MCEVLDAKPAQKLTPREIAIAEMHAGDKPKKSGDAKEKPKDGKPEEKPKDGKAEEKKAEGEKKEKPNVSQMR